MRVGTAPGANNGSRTGQAIGTARKACGTCKGVGIVSCGFRHYGCLTGAASGTRPKRDGTGNGVAIDMSGILQYGVSRTVVVQPALKTGADGNVAGSTPGHLRQFLGRLGIGEPPAL